MSNKLPQLKIEHQYGDRYFNTVLVEGLSVKEMNEILNTGNKNDRDDALQRILNNHDNGNLGDSWRYGYGIYGVKHFGGHLLVTIGNNCD